MAVMNDYGPARARLARTQGKKRGISKGGRIISDAELRAWLAANPGAISNKPGAVLGADPDLWWNNTNPADWAAIAANNFLGTALADTPQPEWDPESTRGQERWGTPGLEWWGLTPPDHDPMRPWRDARLHPGAPPQWRRDYDPHRPGKLYGEN